jgi:hypothetical protein
MIQKLIDKAYEKHPIIWQAAVTSVIVFIMFITALLVWQNTAFGG